MRENGSWKQYPGQMNSSPENSLSPTQHEDESTDMLKSIFVMQASLNDYVFRKNGIVDNDGNILTVRKLIEDCQNGRLGVNDLPNQWIGKYTKAIEEETVELKNDLLWKWWSKDAIDIQNIRVELIDMLHFLVSTMLCAGLTADKLYDIYKQKHAANLARQDAGYSKTTKTEDDNRKIT